MSPLEEEITRETAERDALHAERRALDERLSACETRLASLKRDREREARMDPRPGDRWSEFLAFWLYVVARDGDRVTCMYASAPCEFPKDGTVWEGPVAEFAQNWYYCALIDRGRDVEGWLERATETASDR